MQSRVDDRELRSGEEFQVMSLQATRFSPGDCGDVFEPAFTPASINYEKIESVSAAWNAIKSMKVLI